MGHAFGAMGAIEMISSLLQWNMDLSLLRSNNGHGGYQLYMKQEIKRLIRYVSPPIEITELMLVYY